APAEIYTLPLHDALPILASSDDSKEYCELATFSAHITSAGFFVTESVIDACLVADERDVLLGVAVALAVVIGVAEASLVAALCLLPLAWLVNGKCRLSHV